jgi:hypothetical protein
MLPYEFRAKELDEHQQEENIAELSSVEEEHRSEEAQDPKKKEEKTLENHQEAEQYIVQVMQPLYSPNVIDFDNKKVLIRSDQTESTKQTKVAIDDMDWPRMMKPKNSEVRVSKDKGRKGQSAPRTKPILKHLLNKYVSRKAKNVFNQLGGNKHPRSHSEPQCRQRWRANSYEQQPYFTMQPTYRSSKPPMYQEFSFWNFNHWVPYHIGPAGIFQPKWIQAGPMYRRPLHEKRPRFNHQVRQPDAILIHGNGEKLVSGNSNTSRKYNAYGKNYKAGSKLVWVPISRENYAEARDETDHNCTKSIATRDASLHADLETNNVQTHSEHAVVRASTRESADDASASIPTRGRMKVVADGTIVHGLKVGGDQSVDRVGCGTVQRKDACIKEKGFNNHVVASSSTSQKNEMVSMHSDPATRSISSGLSTSLPSMDLKSSTINMCGQKIIASKVFSQERIFSAKNKLSTQKILCYKPRNSGGNKIKSVAPRTKPEPQWCPTGLTHTQKRRVQRLRVLEIREELAEKKWPGEWFNQDKPMMPTKRMFGRSTSLQI